MKTHFIGGPGNAKTYIKPLSRRYPRCPVCSEPQRSHQALQRHLDEHVARALGLR